jgi:hypothetical protein
VGEGETSSGAEERHAAGGARERLRWKDTEAARAEGRERGEGGRVEEERCVDEDDLARFDRTGRY